MPIPSVTATIDTISGSGTVPFTAYLNASATNTPTAWQWLMLDVPSGSTDNSGTNGNFLNGTASIQAPSFTVNTNGGTYVLQVQASNSSGWSDSSVDGENGQKCVIVESTGGLRIPGKNQFAWGDYMNYSMKKLETLTSASNATSIQGNSVTAVAPSNGQMLYWNNSATKWDLVASSSLSGSGSGVTAHSALTGLTGSDDHKQYLLIDGTRGMSSDLVVSGSVNVGGTVGITGSLFVAGTNISSSINSHVTNTSNPHSVSAAQVGNSVAQWNANQLQGNAVTGAAPVDGNLLYWDSANSAWNLVASSSIAQGTASFSGDATSIQGNAVTGAAPVDGNLLYWDSGNSTWNLVASSSLSGSSDATSIQGNAVTGAAPVDGNMLYWNNSATKWDLVASSSLTGSGGGADFSRTIMTLTGTATITGSTTDPSTSPAWQQIINDAGADNKMEITFSATTNEIILIGFTCTVNRTSSGWWTHWMGFEIDGTVEYWWCNGQPTADMAITWCQIVPHLFSSGSHTIKLVGCRHSSDANVYVFGGTTSKNKPGAILYAIKV